MSTPASVLAASPCPAPAAAAALPLARCRAPGTCGELAQGAIDGEDFLVNCPIDLHAQAAVHASAAGGLHMRDAQAHGKIARALARLAGQLPGCAGREVVVTSRIPRGKGMASSTADLTAALCAVLREAQLPTSAASLAWFGSRRLAAPMDRLVAAARSPGGSLGRDAAALPALDENSGTREVRQAAHVFNAMAGQLQDQFRARGLTMAAVSHDLRTPLTRLRMRLECMNAEPMLQQRRVADIREMNELIDSVLEVFLGDGPDAGQPLQRTGVRALVQSLADDLAEQGQAVSFLAEGEAITLAHPSALRRVVANLVGNAVRYGGGGAAVGVAVDGAAVRIVVDDRGPGIPEQHLQAVTEPFFRLDASRSRHTGGTGLGVRIARPHAAPGRRADAGRPRRRPPARRGRAAAAPSAGAGRPDAAPRGRRDAASAPGRAVRRIRVTVAYPDCAICNFLLRSMQGGFMRPAIRRRCRLARKYCPLPVRAAASLLMRVRRVTHCTPPQGRHRMISA